jgi:hypothetical protein
MSNNTIIINGKRFGDDDEDPEKDEKTTPTDIVQAIMGFLLLSVLVSASVWLVIKIWRSILV